MAAVVVGVTLAAAPYASASSATPRSAGRQAVAGATQQGIAQAPAAARYADPQQVTSSEEFDELLHDNQKVVVMFTATWCGPCKVITPKYVTLSKEHEDVIFATVDVDDLGEVAANAGIRAMPTFQTYFHGAKKGELLGADVGKLRKLVEELDGA